MFFFSKIPVKFSKIILSFSAINKLKNLVYNLLCIYDFFFLKPQKKLVYTFVCERFNLPFLSHAQTLYTH